MSAVCAMNMGEFLFYSGDFNVINSILLFMPNFIIPIKYRQVNSGFKLVNILQLSLNNSLVFLELLSFLLQELKNKINQSLLRTYLQIAQNILKTIQLIIKYLLQILILKCLKPKDVTTKQTTIYNNLKISKSNSLSGMKEKRIFLYLNTILNFEWIIYGNEFVLMILLLDLYLFEDIISF